MGDYDKLSKKELLEKLKALEASKPVESHASYNDHEREMENVERLATVSNPHSIPFRETYDHKNIMLYTAVNKRVGPLHPDNARRTMARWKRAGVQLYTRKRTEAEVEAFKQTEEWKTYIRKNEATRKLRHEQSAKGKVDKMVTEVARATAEAVAGAMKK